MKPLQTERSTFVPGGEEHSNYDNLNFNAAGTIKAKPIAHAKGTAKQMGKGIKHHPHPKVKPAKPILPNNAAIAISFPYTGIVLKPFGHYAVGDTIKYRFNPEGYNGKGSYEFYHKGKTHLVGSAKNRFARMVQLDTANSNDSGDYFDEGNVNEYNAEAQKSAPAASVNLAKERPNFSSKLWIPILGTNIGLAAGTLYALNKGCETKGVLGWAALGSVAGLLLSAPIVLISAKSQAPVTANKLDKVAGNPSGETGTGQKTSVATMKAAIVAENIKDGLDQKATENYVNGLTGKELQSMYLMVKMPSDKSALAKRFPDLYKTAPQNENDAYRIMGAVAERIQGEFGISGLTATEFVTSLQSAMSKMFK